MSVNTAESEAAQPVAHKTTSELIYRLEDRPPLPQTLFAAFQHLLAMFVAVITPALLICQALGLPAQDTQHIISMSLFASGVASIIQIKAWGPVGSGLLSIQGTSFNFVAPLIMGGTALKTGGADVPTMMAALFGTLMLASCTERKTLLKNDFWCRMLSFSPTQPKHYERYCRLVSNKRKEWRTL